MRNILIIISCFLVLPTIYGQSYWLIPVQNENGNWCMIDVMQQELQFCDDEVDFQNYNPMFNMESREILANLSQGNGLNVYTIYKTKKNSLEQFIWGLSTSNQELQILTDYRLANLVSGKVMNFIDFNPGDVHINNFLDYEKGEKNIALQIGGESIRKDLPIKANTCQLAELIAFENPLSPLAKSILETSFALKYSITLSRGTDYVLSAKEGELWNAKTNKEFHNNIGGIAKNAALRLNQKQSKSSIEKGYLAIGYNEISSTNKLNQSIIKTGSSLLWGDDQGVLEFLQGDEGIPILQRKWRVENIKFDKEDKFELSLNESLITDQIDDGYHLWMKVKQGKESRLYSSVQNTTFSSICFFEGTQEIEFIKAPEAWVDVQINPANCERDQSGALKMTIIGVESPYNLQLMSAINHEIIYEEAIEGNTIYIEDLLAGKYEIKVIQNNKVVIGQEINIEDESIPDLQIPIYLILDEGDQNVIDASYGMSDEWEYEWTKPNGEVIDDGRIEISSSGTYWLKVSNGTCYSYNKIHVELINDNIESILLYPNPSPNGLIHFELQLENAFNVEMLVTDVAGRRLISKPYKPGIFIEDHFQIYGNGIYFITFTSGSSIRTKKLIVQIPN